MKTLLALLILASISFYATPDSGEDVIYGHDMSYSTDANGNQTYAFKGGTAGKEENACSTAKTWSLRFDQYDHFETDKSPCGDNPADAILKFVKKK